MSKRTHPRRRGGRYTPPLRLLLICPGCGDTFAPGDGVEVGHSCGQHVEQFCSGCARLLADLDAITDDELHAWAYDIEEEGK